MRNISIYKLEQDFVAGDQNNIRKLEAKLIDDEKIFSEISSDYEKDKIKYKDEYIKAKINYLKNHRLYDWLILKYYFETVLFNEARTFPDYQKKEMEKHGWMFPIQYANARIVTSGEFSGKTEELYIRDFHSHFDSLFTNITLGKKDSRVDRYYKQAIACYKSRNYFSCVVTLFPIVESYHSYMNGFDGEQIYKIKNHLTEVENKVKNITQIFELKIKYYINLIEQFNNLAKNHYFKFSEIKDPEPEIINRNRLMHGIFSREVSQKDCLQLFCVISNMVILKTMINANDEMNRLKIEIDKLENQKKV